MKTKLVRWTIRFLAYLLYGKDWCVFLDVADMVAKDVTIPIYGKDQCRFGREARRDRAVFLMDGFGLSDSEINLGCELAHWWRKLGN